ncbi:DUF7344 domain-containing protein [Halovivax limisalsi]|uniref:DUF7344 domain-containing protein n=1 Tax=Halovivax limisalsi TaxID=1453760 RepID=UPI001FFD8C3D|nr:TrmB family transcriptional regulator sugar-binding domain-containing protein [Halovivax limisalsi]
MGNARRQHILRILHDRTAPIDVRALATNLAAAEEEQELVDVTPDEVAAIQADLVHVHLPQLEGSGLVDWDRTMDTATTTDHPALSDPKFQQLLETDAPGREAVAATLAARRRRIILATLMDAEDALTREELARRVVARERDDSAPLGPDAGDGLLVALHHVHLPKLREADLVSYDAETKTVEYTGHPALDDEWLDFRPDETPRAIVPTASHPDDIWTIDGRDNVIARGQSLFEQAESELFLMFTTTGLLEDGCLRRLRAAADRGVDVYLGSQTREVRDLVREEVPEATIWEPQLDWLNLPPEHEKVGRLVMADREAIMLGTLGEGTGDGVHHEEKAITGAGADDPLVMLLRELLGSRLDHLDAQSEDFLEQIPL